MVEENKRRSEEEDTKNTEPKEVKEEPKFSIRNDLRQLLAKADQLHDSTGIMVEHLSRCASLLKEMRATVIKGDIRGATISASGSGKGAGAGNDVAIEMQQPAPVYAVPTHQMEELKLLCLGVLQKAIKEMKIWDPQGDLPEMPQQIATLLSTAKEKGAMADEANANNVDWAQRLTLYEQASGVEPGSSLGMASPAKEDVGEGTGAEGRNCLG